MGIINDKTEFVRNAHGFDPSPDTCRLKGASYGVLTGIVVKSDARCAERVINTEIPGGSDLHLPYTLLSLYIKADSQLTGNLDKLLIKGAKIIIRSEGILLI